MDGYSLSKNYWDWAFENPELVNTSSSALYFFCIEHCNRLGWKEKFGLPTEMAMSAIGIKNYKTYYKALTSLVDNGFIKIVTKSKNQYSANVIALVKNTKANTKALTKAMLKHDTKQVLSSVDIDKPLNQEPLNQETIKQGVFDFVLNEFYKMRVRIKKPATDYAKELILKKLDSLAPNDIDLKIEILQQSITKSWQDVFPIKALTKPEPRTLINTPDDYE